MSYSRSCMSEVNQPDARRNEWPHRWSGSLLQRGRDAGAGWGSPSSRSPYGAAEEIELRWGNNRVASSGFRVLETRNPERETIYATNWYPTPLIVIISTDGSSFRKSRSLVMYTSRFRELKNESSPQSFIKISLRWTVLFLLSVNICSKLASRWESLREPLCVFNS